MRILVMSGLFLVGTALFLAADPVNVTGAWSGNMTADTGATAEIQFQLKQVGDRITGAAGPTGALEPIYDVTIQGDHLKFSVGHDPKPVWKFDLIVSDKAKQCRAEARANERDRSSAELLST
jgi:hypothetical protein